MRTYLLLTAFILNSSVFAQNELKVGTKAPNIEFDRSFTPSYKIPSNKPIILDFWATWCAPCVVGLMESNELIDKYKDKFEFVAITDSTSGDIKKLIDAKKLKHHFLLNINSSVFNSYGVEGIPHAFIIDKGVITWSGYARRIDESFLDNYLASGGNVNVQTSNLKGALASAETSTKTLPLGVYQFSISEGKSDKTEYSYVTKFSKDTSTFIANERPLEDILATLHDHPYRIINRIQKEPLLSKRISLFFSSREMDPKFAKEIILKNIGNLYGLEACFQTVDTTAWELTVVDKIKLQKAKTVLSGNNHVAGQYSNDTRADGFMTALNHNLNQLILNIEMHMLEVVSTESTDKIGYDFIKVGAKTFDEFRSNLLNVYGIELKPVKQALTYLFIDYSNNKRR